MVVRKRGYGWQYDFRLLGQRHRKARFLSRAEAEAAEKLRRAEALAPDTTAARLLEGMLGMIPPRSPGVYAIVCVGGFVKIGRAENVADRLRELQVSHPHPLRLLAVLSENPEDERDHHHRWRALRHRGEWFRPSHELREYLEAARAAALAEVAAE